VVHRDPGKAALGSYTIRPLHTRELESVSTEKRCWRDCQHKPGPGLSSFRGGMASLANLVRALGLRAPSVGLAWARVLTLGLAFGFPGFPPGPGLWEALLTERLPPS
jgi:hypothetical protein